MTYVYDIILNFHKKYYNFFEWNSKDIIYHMKKIPLIRVSDKDLNILKYNEVTIDKELLLNFKNKSIMYTTNKNNNILLLISNKKESLGLMFNEEGILLKRSGLLFEESEEIEELSKELEITKIKYVKNKENNITNTSRKKENRTTYIKKYLNNIKDDNIFKYLYYDIYNNEIDNNKEIKRILLKENNNNLIDKLYNTIKLLNKQKN